jgi:arylsulfatase A-like enzyme
MSGFPYDLSTIDKDYDLILNTPFGNDVLTNFILSALDNNDFGTDDYTDFFMISFSATDYIGHDSGPYSVEVEDTYLRLDKNIAEILNRLDEKIGKGNYTVFLTSDHGVSSISQYLKSRNFSEGTFQKNEVVSNLRKVLSEKYGEGQWLEYAINNQFFLNHDLIKEKGLDLNTMSKCITDFLLEIEGISEAYTANEVRQFSLDERGIKGMLARGYNSKRSGDVVYELHPGWLLPYKNDATNHFSGYTYDTHVPMLWYGNGIKKGFSVKYQTITNIAPTVSMMLDITLPNGATADPLYELF